MQESIPMTDTDTATGRISQGINNIYIVHTSTGAYQCRIKGKTLRSSTQDDEYSPLAPGDIVDIQITTRGTYNEGMIISRRDRISSFGRWNSKRGKFQILAANIDEVFCFSSVDNPPFRPRFIDRVCVCAGNVPVTIVINKSDLQPDGLILERIQDYRRVGYRVLFISTMTGQGLNDLEAALAGRTSVFVGQSGVGKTSAINRLFPASGRRVGEISEKYNRGRHTTNYGVLLEDGERTVIDTPGVREIFVPPMTQNELAACFPEIMKYQGACAFQPCSHQVEPHCAVVEAVERGEIHEDRYDSYLRILESLEESPDVYRSY